MTKVEYKFENSNNGVVRPFIPVLITNPQNGKSIKVRALIDTGADYCAFPKYVATSTGHNLKAPGVISNVNFGIGGIQIPTWKHTFIVSILDPSETKTLKTTTKLLISCFDHDNAPPLLGGNDLLIGLGITFDYRKKTITLFWD